MISPRITKVLRDVGSNKSRTMLVVMSIAIGVFAVGTTLTIRDVMAREMQRNWDISSPRSARINLQGFGQDFVNSIRQMPEIAEAKGRSNAFARAQVNGSDELKYIIVNAIDKFDDMRLDKIEKEDVPPGVWPPAKRVAGTIHTPDEGGGSFLFAVNGFVTYDTWEWMDQGRQFGSLLIEVSERVTNSAHIQEVVDLIKKRIENNGWVYSGAEIPFQPGQHPFASTINGIVLLMTALGIASLVLSGFLVINTVSAVLAQHMRQIGMMKAVGARTDQLFRMYGGMVLIFGVLSLFVALPSG